MAAGEAVFEGRLRPGTDSITNAMIKSGAAIDASKLKILIQPHTDFGIDAASTPTTKTKVVYVAYGAATVRGFHATLNDTGTTTAVSFDLKKNGTTILSETADIAHTDADRTVVNGTLSSTALVAGDVLTMVMTVSSSTGAQGPFAWVNIEEATTPS
jgi:hypothetical protein